MSLGTRVPHADALAIAKRLVDELAPICARVKVAGSLRRKREFVSDIEIVAEPLMHADLLGEAHPDIEAVRRVAQRWGELVKNGDRFIQVQLGDSAMKCDLFLVHPPANWWVILAIRTGPATLGQWAVSRMHDHGRRCEKGRILVSLTGEEYPVESEEDFFAAAGLPCLPPARRDSDAALQQVATR